MAYKNLYVKRLLSRLVSDIIPYKKVVNKKKVIFLVKMSFYRLTSSEIMSKNPFHLKLMI